MAIRRRARQKASDALPADRRRRPAALRRVGQAARRISRAGTAARQHQRLLQAVLTGELRECAWETLKAMYFTGSTEQACVDRLAAWSREHGVELEVEQRRAQAGA